MVFPGGMASGISISDFDRLTCPKINAILKSLNKDEPISSGKRHSTSSYEAFNHASWKKWAEAESKRLGLKKPDGS